MSKLKRHVRDVLSLYKNKTFSNFDVASFLNEINLEDFLGVAAADTVPIDLLNEEEHFTICVNLDPIKKKGSHFIVLVGCPTKILYIDSLGLPQYYSEILHTCIKSLNRPVKSLIKSEDRIQSWNSRFCAGYCALACCIYDRAYISNPLIPFYKSGKVSEEKDLEWNDMICGANLGMVWRSMQIAKTHA